MLRNNTDIDGDNDNHHEIKEVKDYYPFGMQIKYSIHSPNSLITGRKHNYGYNGKEESNEIGLGWLDLGARHYDPTIGRFMTIDPMADFINSQSTYVLANNNPVQFIDDYGLGKCENCSFFGKIFRAIGDLFVSKGNMRASGNTKRSQSRATGFTMKKSKNVKGRRRKSTTSNTTSAIASASNSNFNSASIAVKPVLLPQSGLPEIQTPNPRATTPSIIVGGVPRIIPAGKNLSVPTHIQFTGDGTDLDIDAMTRHTLNEIIKTLTDYPLIKLEIYVNYAGVNSLRNNPSFEQRARSQSSKRGRKIVQFLTRRGITPSRVRAIQGETIFEKRKQSSTRRNSQNFKIINN